MKLITLSMALTMWALALPSLYAQDTNSKVENDAMNKAEMTSDQIENLKAARENVIEFEKEQLLQKVEAINKRLDTKIISLKEADNLKNKAAESTALNIENKTSIIDNEIAYIQRNGYLERPTGTSIIVGFGQQDSDNDRVFGIKVKNGGKYMFKDKEENRRTTNEFVVALGLNNAIIDGQSLSDSPYKVAGSRFFELGTSWKTRVFENSNWLRIKYGFSFQFNGLKIDDNQFLVDTGDQTEIQNFPTNLDKAKLRMDNIVVPIHFEFGASDNSEKNGAMKFNTARQFKIGIGGYGGINLSTRQKLKFEENGEDVKQKRKANYNTNNFIYGLSTYAGIGNTSLYLKYDLNSIFKNNVKEQHNVSLGLRFDLD